MAKQNEIDYLDTWLKRFDAADADHALEVARDKPYAFGGECGGYLIDIGSIMKLLPAPPARLLDLGIGTGWTSAMYARNGYDVVGQDISPAMIALAEKTRAEIRVQKLRFVISDYESIGMEGEFDCAVFYDSLHHAVVEKAALKAVFRALKPGGILITLEPGEGHSTSADTLAAVAQFGTTEKDMPPHHILEIAKEVGYHSGKVYAHSSTPIIAYEQDHPPQPPAVPVAPKPVMDRRGKWRRAGSFILGAWRVLTNPLPAVPESPPEPPPPPVEPLLPAILRARNIVVMRKPG